MAAKKPAAKVLPHAFDVQAFLDSAGLSRRVVRFARGARAFAQGSPATSVFYIQSGQVKLSVVSRGGKEAVVAILGPGDFFGEDAWPGSHGAWEHRVQRRPEDKRGSAQCRSARVSDVRK